METTGSNQKSDKTRQNETIYRVAIVVLALAVAALGFFLITSRQTLNEVRTDRAITAALNLELQHELDSVLAEYHHAREEFDIVLEEKDSIIQTNAREIQRLITRQEDYNRIRRQLNVLREITQAYVHEIDSLHTVARVLQAENVQMRHEIQQVRQRTTELVRDKEQLEGKVEVASTLRAYQLQADAIRLRGRDREEETDRARRAEQIRLCFTLAENPIATPGPVNVYMRIAGPDNAILRISDADMYSFVHGQDTLQYSVSSQLDYQNREKSVCLYWERLAEFEPGLYNISLYTDEVKLGETAISLR